MCGRFPRESHAIRGGTFKFRGRADDFRAISTESGQEGRWRSKDLGESLWNFAKREQEPPAFLKVRKLSVGNVRAG